MHDGDFDGLSGADAFCQSLATAAGLPGEYKAWLSDSTGSPSTRFVQATVPYTLVDGVTIANGWSDLIDGTLAAAIDLTELGSPAVGHLNVWTNTLPDGTPGGFEMGGDCEGWTSDSPGPIDPGNTGARSLTTDSWTRFSNHECDLPLHLYCFQQR